MRRPPPPRRLAPWPAAEDDGLTTVHLSPGQWTPPPGRKPGWNWLPEPGASPRLDLVPRWVRWWYRTPFLDRYAHVWMWHHGGWQIIQRPPADPGDEAGDREPLHPRPQPPALHQALEDRREPKDPRL